jgi:hypothetical protein
VVTFELVWNYPTDKQVHSIWNSSGCRQTDVFCEHGNEHKMRAICCLAAELVASQNNTAQSVPKLFSNYLISIFTMYDGAAALTVAVCLLFSFWWRWGEGVRLQLVVLGVHCYSNVLGVHCYRNWEYTVV